MGVRILYDAEGDLAALYCSTTDVAFGPVFYDGDEHNAGERAEAFTRWLKRDARTLTDSELQRAYSEWLAQESAQWAAEDVVFEERSEP
ncbi:MAG TPA: hypothetical protein VFB63_00680 [Bryobacteraceae bacterium]|nr:hypothetical protein [Bryobacteraceae bacterium]